MFLLDRHLGGDNLEPLGFAECQEETVALLGVSTPYQGAGEKV
jgi:hypothetical protein